jgi:hypothetical protein
MPILPHPLAQSGHLTCPNLTCIDRTGCADSKSVLRCAKFGRQVPHFFDLKRVLFKNFALFHAFWHLGLEPLAHNRDFRRLNFTFIGPLLHAEHACTVESPEFARQVPFSERLKPKNAKKTHFFKLQARVRTARAHFTRNGAELCTKRCIRTC